MQWVTSTLWFPLGNDILGRAPFSMSLPLLSLMQKITLLFQKIYAPGQGPSSYGPLKIT